MDTERDLLRTIVTSRLDHLYQKKGLTFEFIDLRYSVTTNSELTIEEREQQIFDHCMEEIERCAPYFIGLIGHRYGWIPLHKTSAQEAYIDNIWDDHLTLCKDDMSVTALEFLHGATGRFNDERTGKFIFVRSEESYGSTPEEEASDFFDCAISAENNRIMREYVKGLDGKRGIRTREYTLSPTTPTTEEMERWCDMVVAEIKTMIDEKFANQIDLDPFHAANERYVAEHIRNFKGRDELLINIIDMSLSQIFISGEAGTGRTSFLCKSYDLMRRSENVIALFASSHTTPQDFNARTLASKWARQISYTSRIALPKVLENTQDYDLTTVCDTYDDYLQEVESATEYTIIHFVEGSTEEFNELMRKNSRLVMLQEQYSSNLKFSCIDTTELDYTTRKEIAGQLRPMLRERLLEHPSSYNIGWLSLAVHILENLMRGRQKEMRKGHGSLSREEAITAYLCDMVKCFPANIDELQSFWITQLQDIFGSEFVRDYMCCLKLSPYGVTDEYVACVTNAPLMWCISFRQTAGNNILSLNQLNLWELNSRETALNLLRDLPAAHLKGMAVRVKEYLESQAEDHPECCNLFFVRLQLRDFLALREYFGRKEFYSTKEYRGERNYAWIRFVIEQPFEAQAVIGGILDVLPIDTIVWKDFIACQGNIPVTSRFLFMRLIEIKINEILILTPDCGLRRVMQDVYKMSVNSAPDAGTRRIELRKYLHFYSELFGKDSNWREEYLAAVTFQASYISREMRHEFLMYHFSELRKRNALTYDEGEPTREFAKLFFMLTVTFTEQRDFYQALQGALCASELFHNAFKYLLQQDMSQRETVEALNCYHTVTLQLIFLYERFNFTHDADTILTWISGFVKTVDAIIEKFDGLGSYGDDSVADECRAVYLYSRIFLIGTDESRPPEERLKALEDEHQICLNLTHNNCRPRADDTTMPQCGIMAMMMLIPTATLWMTLAHIMICYEAAYIIYRHRLTEEHCGQFVSFSLTIGLAVSWMWQKSMFPGGAPILLLIFDFLKLITGALVEANRDSFLEEAKANIDKKLHKMLQILDSLPPDLDIAGELLAFATYSTDNIEMYEEMLVENRLEDIVRYAEECDVQGFFDLYYLGLASLRLDAADDAKYYFSILLGRRRLLDKNREFSCMCNYLAACLKDLDFDNFEHCYTNLLSDADKEDCDVVELQTLYHAFRSGNIDADTLKESIEGFPF